MEEKTKIYIKKVSIVFFLLLLYVLYLNNYYLELFYKATGKIIKDEVSVYFFDIPKNNFNDITNSCLSKAPKNCKLIRIVDNGLRESKYKGFESSRIFTCYYGCPK